MRKGLLLLALLLTTVFPQAQVYRLYPTQNIHNQLRLNTKTGAITQIQDDGQSWTICTDILQGSKANRYCLYETENMWTFIMLDKYTGKTWQIQYSIDGPDYKFAEPINSTKLAFPKATSNWSNRFKMIKTQNMWTFILLDTYNGRLWQVQYDTHDLDNTFCIPINEQPLASTQNSVFSIHPLTSMFQYYLINESTGKMWKFQWSTKGDDYRWIEDM